MKDNLFETLGAIVIGALVVLAIFALGAALAIRWGAL